jgi:tRNA A37 methylthiotransferase MiaB
LLEQTVNKMNLDYRKKFINKELEVLIERTKDNFYFGKSENYIDLSVLSFLKLEKKKRYKVLFTEIDDDVNFGELIKY